LLPPRPTLFPYTTLFRSDSAGVEFQLHQKRWTAMESRLVGELYGLGLQPPSHTARMILSLAGVEYPIPISDTGRMAEGVDGFRRSEEHTSELQSLAYLVC